MSDFDFVPPVQDDPAAEFLAREQSALGDLDEDFAFTSDGGETKDPQFTDQSADIKLNGDFTNGDFVEPPLSNDDIVDNGLSNGISDLSLNKQEPEQPALVIHPIMPPEEPESIKKWREDHIRALAEKDTDEEKKIAELKEQGKKELEDWYSRYAEQLEKLKQQNRNAEKEFVAERDNEEPGQNWEKISRLCDFNPKTSRNNRDTTRMRSILLQLKTSPPPSSSSTTASSAAQQVSS